MEGSKQRPTVKSDWQREKEREREETGRGEGGREKVGGARSQAQEKVEAGARSSVCPSRPHLLLISFVIKITQLC